MGKLMMRVPVMKRARVLTAGLMASVISGSVAFASLPTAGSAPQLPSHCETAGVEKIERTLSNSKKFYYRFRLSVGQSSDLNPGQYPGQNPEAPAVIFLPGGPGQTSMQVGLAYPDEFSIVRTDPRGVGCNVSAQLEAEDFSSVEMARDVLAIVRKLKLTSYILHGISHGSVVATIAASLASSEGLPVPQAVVIEAVMGRSFAPNEYNAGYFREWARVTSKLPQDTQSVLRSQSLPFGFSSRQWAAYLIGFLIFGEFEDGTSLALDEFTLLGPDVSPLEKTRLETRVAHFTAPPSPEKTKL